MAIVLKVLAAVGLLLNAVLVFRKISQLRKTETGAEKWEEGRKHIIYNTIVGIAANFLDVFGIGSYALSSELSSARRS